MVTFHSYVSLPEGIIGPTGKLFWNWPAAMSKTRFGLWTLLKWGQYGYSDDHLLVITGYNWDYTFYKWGYK